MDQDSRISAPVRIYVQVSVSQAQVGDKHSSTMPRKILIFPVQRQNVVLSSNCLFTAETDKCTVIGTKYMQDE